MKVSVIVPMYNVEAYVEQCLTSLQKQTLSDMEVIMVDDGCSDHTPEIAMRFVKENPERFQLLHKENGGLSDARNYGIPYAKGKYLAFLDSDDFVEPTFYEDMANKMDEGFDVVVSDIEYWYEDASKRHIMKGLTTWQADTIQKKALLSPMFAWNKMYLTSLFQEEGYRYPLKTWYEDIPVTTLLFAKTKKIGYLERCEIHYRQREGSIMSAVNSDRVGEIFQVMAQVRENFEREGLLEEYHDEIEYLHIEHLRLYGMFRFIRSNHWKEYYETSNRVMMTCFPNWKQNPYIKNLSKKNQIFLKWYNRLTAWIFHAMIK